LLVPSSLKLISRALPDPDARARAVGLWIGCGGVGMAAGPLIGGLMISFLGWRSIFFVNIPVGLIGIWLTSRIASDGRIPARRFDPAGQIMAILALAALIAVLIEGSRMDWSSPLILSGIGVGVAAGVAFFIVEARSAEPMLPLCFFKNRIFTGSTFVSMASALVFFGLLFVLSLYYQRFLSYKPASAGLAFLPMITLAVAGSIFSDRLIKLLGPRGSMWAAFGSYIAGSLGLLAIISTSSYWLAVLPMLAIGIASGFVSPAATAPAIGTVEQSRAGVAAAVLNSARQTGAALGVAIFGTFIESIQPFYSGMRAALWAATAVSFSAILVWWFSSVQERADTGLYSRESRANSFLK
jgi:MFS transporter, DHA2 family, methylenomycin A resistance protein